MKKIFVVLSFWSMLAVKPLMAQDAGIKFFHGTWQELMNESKKQKKPIFVDAFTVWCGPCRWMSANVFPNEAVGKFFNNNFINYKFDMEQGEGPEFGRNYQVKAYPTLLFMDNTGAVKYRILGGRQPEDFIKEGEKALQEFAQ